MARESPSLSPGRTGELSLTSIFRHARFRATDCRHAGFYSDSIACDEVEPGGEESTWRRLRGKSVEFGSGLDRVSDEAEQFEG